MLDDSTLAIPERPGNRRVGGRNILTKPHVGLVFFLPGRGDTLRINGRARLVSDAPFFEAMVVEGHRPVLAMVVEVEQVFHHCSKALLRSHLRDPSTWEPDTAPPRARIAEALERPAEALADIKRYYGPSYAEGLYRSR